MSDKRFKFDINCSEDMITSFMNQYKPLFPTQQNSKKKQKLSNGDVKNNDFYELIKKVISNCKWNDVKTDNMFNTHLYGSELKLTYYPLSQRYVDYYDEQTFIGTLFYGDEQSDNAILYYEHNNVVYVKSLERDGCHYMGMARGYEYFINE